MISNICRMPVLALHNRYQSWLLVLALMAPATVSAACSRPINVPMSPTGLSVIEYAGELNGIYPEVLTSLSSKEDCEFKLSLVPRARQEFLFENGQADMLLPATRTPRRDQSGIFVTLLRSRATLISIDTRLPPVQSLRELLEQGKSRVVVVRGFDYGEAYQQFLVAMQKSGRIVLEADPLSAARVLKFGGADYALMAPTIFGGALALDNRVSDLATRLRMEAVTEIPWGDNGLYLSKKALSPEDFASLKEMFEKLARSGTLWKAFQRYYRSDVLKEGIKPLDSSPAGR